MEEETIAPEQNPLNPEELKDLGLPEEPNEGDEVTEENY